MALKGDIGFLTEESLRQMIEDEGRRIAATPPDTPLRRYSIEAGQIFQDCCARMIEGAGTVDELSAKMLARQKAAAIRHDVRHLL